MKDLFSKIALAFLSEVFFLQPWIFYPTVHTNSESFIGNLIIPVTHMH